jgi:RNA polymerase sigma factor (sigma-70 family)
VLDGVGRTDGQLLASFIDQKDETAFEAIVRRHGPMVFGVCRRVVGTYHDAEDAFQATFLVLARKATSIRPREQVANWLHGVAIRTAMKAKAMTAKRRGREQQVREMLETQTVQQDQWPDLEPLIDQELNGLPQNYRLPILLCDLEGKTIKEAARQLGWPQGTVAGRLARGRKLLGNRLSHRGVLLSAGSLAVVMSQNVASAVVPTALMSSTVKAATIIAAGKEMVAGVVPAKVAVLTEGVLKSMFLTKLKVVMVLLVVAALSGAAGLIYQTQAAEQPPAQRASDKADKEEQLAAKKDEKPKSDKERLQGTWITEDEFGKITLTFDDATIKATSQVKAKALPGGTTYFHFRLDEMTNPKKIDMVESKPFGETEPALRTWTGDRTEGIYSFDGDTLRINMGPKGKRPTGFDALPLSGVVGYWTATLKREPKDDTPVPAQSGDDISKSVDLGPLEEFFSLARVEHVTELFRGKTLILILEAKKDVDTSALFYKVGFYSEGKEIRLASDLLFDAAFPLEKGERVRASAQSGREDVQWKKIAVRRAEKKANWQRNPME